MGQGREIIGEKWFFAILYADDRSSHFGNDDHVSQMYLDNFDGLVGDGEFFKVVSNHFGPDDVKKTHSREKKNRFIFSTRENLDKFSLAMAHATRTTCKIREKAALLIAVRNA